MNNKILTPIERRFVEKIVQNYNTSNIMILVFLAIDIAFIIYGYFWGYQKNNPTIFDNAFHWIILLSITVGYLLYFRKLIVIIHKLSIEKNSNL